MFRSNHNSRCARKSSLVIWLLVIFNALIVNAFAQVPSVYDVENTGAHFPPPVFPLFDGLPVVQRLPDPFQWANGIGRNTGFASWERRRNEIKAQIEHYEIGPKPDCSDCTITAAYANGELTVVVVRNGRALTLNSRIALPSGTGPFPAVIGMALAPGNGSTGSLPSSVFTSRGIATIDYVHNEVTEYAAGQQISHAADPYFLLYPEYQCPGNVGQYSAWAWGVSRLIDGLEIAAHQTVNQLPIDLSHLAVTGCSYAGKMALFAGAFDERIALTIAQESGGGGAPAWRVSQGIEPLGTVEKIDNTDGSWFMQGMKTTFAGHNVYKLPEDHHELMAMVAPRALLVTGNTDFTWLSNRSAYVSARATQKVYETLGIGDRFGFYIDGGHGHCAVPEAEVPSIQAFVDKFLLGDMTVDSNVRIYPQTDPFTSLDYLEWIPWANLPPASYSDQIVNALVAMQAGNAHSGGGLSSFELMIKNTSSETIFAPVRVEVAQLTSASGNVTVNNSDNDVSGVGAFWNYSNTVGLDNLLSPGETSAVRSMKFNNANNERFTVTFNVIANGAGGASSSANTNSSGGTEGTNAGSSSGSNAANTAAKFVFSVTYNPLLNTVRTQLLK